MSFRDSVRFDIGRVFLNADEFGEVRDVRYAGSTFSRVPMVISEVKETEAKGVSIEGIFRVKRKVYISDDALGMIPEENQMIGISDGMAVGQVFFRVFRIVTVSEEMGMVCMELEACDE